MRRTTRVTGWIVKALLLAVALAGVVCWWLSVDGTLAVRHVRALGSPGEGRFETVVFGCEWGGAWCESESVRVKPPDSLDEGVWELARWVVAVGWSVERSGNVAPWRWSDGDFHGRGRLGWNAWARRWPRESRRGWSAAAPLWGVVLLCGAWPLVSLRRALKEWVVRRRAPREGLCPECGYDWRATPGRCSECGYGNA